MGSILGDAGTGAGIGAAAAGLPGAVVGGAIGAGTALVGDAINYFTNKSNNSQAIKLWNMNNAYNTPAAQMGRLRAAGLNPNLVYGSGTVVGNSSGGAPPTNRPDVGSGVGQAGQIVGQMYQIAQQALQLANTQANTQKTSADTGLVVSQNTGQDLTNSFNTETFGQRVKQQTYDTRNSLGSALIKDQTLQFNDSNNPNLLQEQVYKTAAAGFAPGLSQADLNQKLQNIDFTTMQNQLMKLGIAPGSTEWLNSVGSIVHKLFPNFSLLSK